MYAILTYTSHWDGRDHEVACATPEQLAEEIDIRLKLECPFCVRFV